MTRAKLTNAGCGFACGLAGAAVLLLALAPLAHAARAPERFALVAPGVAGDPAEALSVAVVLKNTGPDAAVDIALDAIQLERASPLEPPLPMQIGRLEPGGSARLEAKFKSSAWTPGRRYRLVVRGHYSAGGPQGARRKAAAFSASCAVEIPPRAPGAAREESGSAPAQRVRGAPFPHQPRNPDENENGSRWTVPNGPGPAPQPAGAPR